MCACTDIQSVSLSVPEKNCLALSSLKRINGVYSNNSLGEIKIDKNVI